MNTIQEKIFNVPVDICLDIFKVLLENRVEFELIGIKEKQNSLVIKILPHSDFSFYVKMIENIESILRDYKSYLNGGSGSETD